MMPFFFWQIDISQWEIIPQERFWWVVSDDVQFLKQRQKVWDAERSYNSSTGIWRKRVEADTSLHFAFCLNELHKQTVVLRGAGDPMPLENHENTAYVKHP